jgi:hypothetical protein
MLESSSDEQAVSVNTGRARVQSKQALSIYGRNAISCFTHGCSHITFYPLGTLSRDRGVTGKGIHERPVAVGVGVGVDAAARVVEAAVYPSGVQVGVGTAEEGGGVGERLDFGQPQGDVTERGLSVRKDGWGCWFCDDLADAGYGGWIVRVRSSWETRMRIVSARWVLLILMRLSGLQVGKPTEREVSISCIWQLNRTKIRPELTFPLIHTMPL